MRATMIALAAMFIASGLASAQDSNSANKRLSGCRSLVASDGRGAGQMDAIDQGICLGEIAALLEVSPLIEANFRFCKPEGASVEQAVRIVLKAAEQAPETTHLNFVMFSMFALKKAWPCPT